MPSSGVIDLAIGLVFVFGVTAALASMVTELISRFLGLRAAYLLSGLRALVDDGEVSTDLSQARNAYEDVRGIMDPPAPPQDPGQQPPPQDPGKPSATGALLGSPILRSQGMAGQISSRNLTLTPGGRTSRPIKPKAAGGLWSKWSQSRGLPAYISSQSFGEAVVDLLVPNTAGQTTMDTIQANIKKLPDSMGSFRSSLQALAAASGNDVTRLRTSVESWYDDHMDRVSGWYKRHVSIITLVAGTILVVLFNINALNIGRTLYTQNTVSSAISAVAAKGPGCPANATQAACLAHLQAQVSAAATAGLPIGWGTVRDCTQQHVQCNWLDQRGIFSRHGGSGWQLVLVILGFLIMIIALVPGAQFWFGLLSKIGSLRSTGPKPANAGS
jgi:hypothetical protein